MFINTIHESSAGSSRLDAWAAELLTCRIPRAYYSSLTLTLSVCMCVCHCCNNCCVHLNIYCWKCTESPPAAWRALTRFLWLSVFWWWITHTHTHAAETHWHTDTVTAPAHDWRAYTLRDRVSFCLKDTVHQKHQCYLCSIIVFE